MGCKDSIFLILVSPSSFVAIMKTLNQMLGEKGNWKLLIGRWELAEVGKKCLSSEACKCRSVRFNKKQMGEMCGGASLIEGLSEIAGSNLDRYRQFPAFHALDEFHVRPM